MFPVTSTSPTQIEIKPAPRPVEAVIQVPGSKSITNRALLLAALADGESVLENALFSEDSHWFSECLRRLGIEVESDSTQARMIVQGKGGRFPVAEADLFVGNSGTTARFLVAAACLGQGTYRFDGVPRMRQRPIGPLLASLRLLGARFSFEGEPECFPLTVHAAGLRGGQTELDVTASSQYLTGLLMAVPYAAERVEIQLKGTLVSLPYIEMTLRMMADFGIARDMGIPDAGHLVPDKGNYRNYSIPSGQKYRAQRYWIEPDASNATYFFAAAAVTGGKVRVPHLPAESLQGDVAFVDVLAQMGCEVTKTSDYIEVRGTGKLRGLDVDMNAISDTAQTLASIAPFADSPVNIRNIGHIRHKETDRINAVVTELRRLGAQVEESAEGMTIYPSTLRPAAIETYDDHRMAMAFSVTGLASPGVTILNPGCTAKTFPDFFERFEGLYR